MKFINVCDLVNNHFIGRNFVRMDIFVRLLAIEHYYEKNDFGIKMYDTMQPYCMGKRFEHRKNGFKALIESFEENGYVCNKENALVLNQHMRIAAGAHRLACCMYFGIQEIPYVVDLKSRKDTKRTVEWLKSKDLIDAVHIAETIIRSRLFFFECSEGIS